VVVTCKQKEYHLPQKREGVWLVEVHYISCHTTRIGIHPFVEMEWSERFQRSCMDKKIISDETYYS